MYLIVGGTGSLGTALARRLREAGRSVRVTTRTPERASALASRGAEVVQADLRDRASLERACRGAEVVVAAAHSLFGRGDAASARVDGRGHRELVDAAAAAGVRRFVYTSVLDFGLAFRPVPFFRIKHETERYLEASGIAYTILRPAAFMDVHAHMLIGEPIARTGKAVLFGRGERPRNFVAADDVARIALLAADDPASVGETIDVGGPEDLSNMEVVRLYERLCGRRARVRHVPLSVVRTAARVMRPLHPGVSQVLQMAAIGDTVDQRFDAAPLARRFGIELTRLEDWAARRLRAEAP